MEKPNWEVVSLPPNVAEMSDEERVIYFDHLKNGTVPVVKMSKKNIIKKYGKEA